jgi:glutathione S-transferase
LKLYSHPASRFAARCRIQIRAKGLDVAVEDVSFPVSDAYRRINPLGLIPALELDDGDVLIESAVICEYLEDVGQGPSLRPGDARLRATMRLIMRLLDLNVAPLMNQLYPVMFAGGRADPSMAERLRVPLGMIARHLPQQGGFAVGGALSLADCALMPILRQMPKLMRQVGLPDHTQSGPWPAYFAAVAQHPAVAAVMAEMAPTIESWGPRPAR